MLVWLLVKGWSVMVVGMGIGEGLVEEMVVGMVQGW